MDKHELEALADAMLAEHRSAPQASTAPQTPPPAATVAPAPTDDIEAWADALLAQHRTPPQPDKAPLFRRLMGRS